MDSAWQIALNAIKMAKERFADLADNEDNGDHVSADFLRASAERLDEALARISDAQELEIEFERRQIDREVKKLWPQMTTPAPPG